MNFKIEEVPSFYQGYIEQVESADLRESLLDSGSRLIKICKELTEEQTLYRYAEGKWSIKDIIQHLIDAEKVFLYRALRFSRGDRTSLGGFDQNDYVDSAVADNRSFESLMDEFHISRKCTVQFFSSLDAKWLARKGEASGVEMTVEMLGFIIAGHTFHHARIIENRYLS